MGKRVRGRKRDGRRSSLPPPPPGEATESGESTEATESSQLAGEEMDDRVSVTGIEASSSNEVVAVEVLTLPKSASALLSAALPSSARTPVATPANPSSGVTPAVADVSSASSVSSEGRAPEPSDLTPIIDMPTLVESADAETTRPDAAPLALEEQETGDAVAAAAAEPPAPAAAAPVAAAAAAADPGITRQPSVPDPTEVSFFDPATVSAHVARAHEPSDAHDIHSLSEAEILHRRRRMPEVAARRMRLAKVVQITVGTAGALIILAVLLHLSAGTGQAGGSGHTSEMLVAPPSNATSEPVKTTGATVETTPPATAVAAASAPAAPEAALDAAAAAAVDPATTAAPAASSAESVALAALAQKALEKGKLGDAIDAGEQATTLDPGDARSWLVLGGAYQERGDMQNARRCYTACVQHATRGPVNECRALGGR